MKRFKLFASGKKFALVAVMVSGIVFFNQSCKKDDSTSADVSVSQDEAAEAITQSLSANGGMADEYSRAQVVTGAQEGKLKCGESASASITKTSATGATISYTATVSWTWKFNCVTPANITFASKGHIKYDAPRMSSDDSSHSDYVITGIGASSSQYNINGVYTRDGSQQSKIGNKNTFTSNIVITSQDVKVGKASHIIESGTAAIAITGASSSGKSFSFAGTITFLGNKKATIVFAGGATYNISW